ncbi:MAG TPA: hypothetical protein VFH91_08575 [Pyrinomonadaceae bacterium]|nr:hypothetical protein [Pyrinomonadaceae bacterium]
MKRCPQCQFIYLNSDEQCDFDQTLLVSIDDETVEAAIRTNSSKVSSPETVPSVTLKSPAKKLIPILVAALLLLILGLGLLGVYLIIKTRSSSNGAVNQITAVTLPSGEKPQAVPNVRTPIVESTPEPTPKVAATPTRNTNSRAAVSIGPVSTSGVSNHGKTSGKPIILLTTGGRIEADQVWRAKEGIWYRRDGIVTLLKRERVRAIVGQ